MVVRPIRLAKVRLQDPGFSVMRNHWLSLRLARCMLYIQMREQAVPQCTRWIVRAKLTLRERACLHAMPARSP